MPRAAEATATMGGLRGIDMFRKIPADLTSATTTGAILSVALPPIHFGAFRGDAPLIYGRTAQWPSPLDESLDGSSDT